MNINILLFKFIVEDISGRKILNGYLIVFF